MKCPFCQDYSMTYDWLCNWYICHVYNAVIRAEDMPRSLRESSSALLH